jgi:hypothetical protein
MSMVTFKSNLMMENGDQILNKKHLCHIKTRKRIKYMKLRNSLIK